MKVLLLSCSTGEGHNSAAFALQEELESRGVDCVLADPVAFGSEKARKAVANTYNNIIKKVPAAFGMLYKVGDWYSAHELPSPIYYANSLYADNLCAFIEEQGFDLVVCTHLYAMEAMTCIHKKGMLSVPCYGVLTDYTCIPFFSDTRLTGYFIPHEELKQEVAAQGIPAERIFCTGIPVSPRFNQSMTRQEARNYLVLDQDRQLILVMTGGVGCGNGSELCEKLLAHADERSCIQVLCGRNSEMKEKIDSAFARDPRVQTVTFTKKVDVYMKAADVLITKPGGISSSEAATVGIPLVLAMGIPGCETKNCEFFAGHGMAVKADTLDEAASSAWYLARNEKAAERMVSMQHKTIHADAAARIADILTGVSAQ